MMKKLIQKIRSRRGVSLIEILVALTITGLVTSAIMELYVTQHKSYMIQEDVTEIQQNVRASIDELSRNIRMAGFELPIGLDGLRPSNSNPDTIVVLYADDDCDTYLSAPMPQPSAELKCGSDVSCFYPGQWVYIYDADSAVGEWFEVSWVQESSMHIQHRESNLSRKYSAKSLVLSMVEAKYYIDNTTDPEHPTLMVQYRGQNPQVYAENVSDLQFRYRMKNGAVEDEPTLIENVREVLIDVAGHSANPERVSADSSFSRDRSFATSVYLRNIGI